MFRRILLYVLYAIAVVAIIGGVIFAFGSNNDNKETTTAQAGQTPITSTPGNSTTSQNTSTQTAGTPTTSQNTSRAGTTAVKSSTTSSTTTTANTSGTASTRSSGQLSSTGPNGVVTLFVVVSLLGFTSYRYMLIKRPQ